MDINSISTKELLDVICKRKGVVSKKLGELNVLCVFVNLLDLTTDTHNKESE